MAKPLELDAVVFEHEMTEAEIYLKIFRLDFGIRDN